MKAMKAMKAIFMPGTTACALAIDCCIEPKVCAAGADKDVTLRARVDHVAARKYRASAGGYPGSGDRVLGAPHTSPYRAQSTFDATFHGKEGQ
ncbi:MAG: hypothetical protein ACI83P_001176 [Janthinobacterium sp.]|jgi:hypothetical protein